MMETMTGFGLVTSVFLFVLAILWFLLPFAIFGTKDRLDAILQEMKALNKELTVMRAELQQIKNNKAHSVNE
jgi:outer membrane lipoprotein-sorting protein